MTPTDPAPDGYERYWRDFMTKRSLATFGRAVFERLPGESRCSTCATPFDGFGARLLGLMGRARHEHDEICSGCVAEVAAHPGGAEIEGSVVVARYGQVDRPDGFDDELTQIVLDHHGIVDRRSRESASAFFAPALSKEQHPADAVATARELLAYTSGGIGVHTGRLRVGMLDGDRLGHICVAGDVVDTTVDLADLARPPELIVSADAAAAAALDGGTPAQVLVASGSSSMDVIRLAAD